MGSARKASNGSEAKLPDVLEVVEDEGDFPFDERAVDGHTSTFLGGACSFLFP